MSSPQLIGLITGLGLIGIYSWVMTASSGTNADWAWVILLAAAAVLIGTGRSVTAQRSTHRDVG